MGLIHVFYLANLHALLFPPGSLIVTKYAKKLFANTVEPLNNGHFGTSNFWHNFTGIERLSSLRGKIVLP